jgi:hypothetical protein
MDSGGSHFVKDSRVQEAEAPWLAGDRSAWDGMVRGWLERVAASNGFGRIVQWTEVKARPWSLVYRVVFTHRIGYFKACGRGGRHEANLLAYLQQQGCGFIPRLLAVDRVRAWMLLEDAGAPLRDAVDVSGQLGVLRRLLPRYGEMQLESRKSLAQLEEFGLPDRRLPLLPGLLVSLVSGGALDADAGKAGELRVAVLAAVPALERCCAALGASGYAAALEHGDLHTGNILVAGKRVVICDWGDACLTHPFCSLGVMLETLLGGVAASERGRTAAQLVAAYLEPWSGLASRATLVAEVQAAVWLAHVLRALDFAHMCRGREAAAVGPGWQTLIEESLAAWVGLVLPALAR